MLTIVFGTLCILFIIYIIYIQMQLHNINRLITKRLREKTRQPISLELINSDLNTLATNINRCLAREERLCIDSIKREKCFKELIANMSHDLRTPLTAIKGYHQLMEKGEMTDNKGKKLGIAQKHTAELGQVIEHFFEYSYLINSEPEVNMERINLTNLVTECLAASVPIFEENC
ncbi:histidine kinase dimerization/phospho-acceptor domain-containing protein [Clostridium sp.]|uniref:histidine kinase dimerization/phospho-acceptor domain-containing protein n=1 Tax=Clostridium sp. TaxID=1506 RepID=UPI003D6CE429